MSTERLLSDEELGQLAPIGIKNSADRDAFLRQLALAFKDKSCTKKCYLQLKRAILELAASQGGVALKNLEMIKKRESMEQQLDHAREAHARNPSSKDLSHAYNVLKDQHAEFIKRSEYKTAVRFKNRMLGGITVDDIDAEIKSRAAEETAAKSAASPDASAVIAPSTAFVSNPVHDFLGMSMSAVRDAAVEKPLVVADESEDLLADEPDIPTPRLLNKTIMKRFIKMQAENNDAENKLSESMLLERFLREAKEKHADLAKKKKEAAQKKKEQAHEDGDDDDDDVTQKKKRQKRDRSVTTDFGSLYFVLFGPMCNHFKFGFCYTIMCERMRHYMPGEGPLHLVWRLIINAGANTRQTTQTIEGT